MHGHAEQRQGVGRRASQGLSVARSGLAAARQSGAWNRYAKAEQRRDGRRRGEGKEWRGKEEHRISEAFT